MTTQAQIIKRALVRAGVIAYDATPTDAQKNQAEVVLLSTHEDLVDSNLVSWELSDIPSAMVNPLVSVLAKEISDDFGVSSERYQRITLAANQGMDRIMTYNEIPYSGETSTEHY